MMATDAVAILYFDFAKEFNSVPHIVNCLISKLQVCGASGKLLT